MACAPVEAFDVRLGWLECGGAGAMACVAVRGKG